MNLLSNAKWNTFSQLFKVLVQIVNLVYLAKIIPPSEYGLMAMALVILNFGIMLRDLGTSAALIQRESISHSFINTVFWLNLILGGCLCILVMALSPFIAELYDQPKLVNVLLLLSITFPLSSCASAHLALLERDSMFKKISFIEISSSFVSILVAITLANHGFGVYSLVFQAIVLSAMSTVQFWLASPWHPSFYPFMSFKELKNIFGFSANLSLFNFINYFSRNADSFIIGKYMSAVILGNYNLAYRIMLFPLQSLSFVTTRSLYPILSRKQNDNESISKIYLDCVFVILLIAFPLMSGLAFFSKPFVLIIFGNQWELVSDILKWLAPTAIIQAVLSTSGAVFMAKGRTDILMRLGIIGAILQVGSFLIGVRFSINTFALCYLIANAINFFPVMYFLLKLINTSFFLFFKKIMPIILSVISMLFFLFFLSQYIPTDSIHSITVLLFVSIIGAFVYFIAMLLLSSLFRLNLLSFIRKLT
ncbi:TPA: MOP flippase family protein [Raoultella ornithinolytica]|nr:MOP flippase family protein [Raoultella ornithinolytica]